MQASYVVPGLIFGIGLLALNYFRKSTDEVQTHEGPVFLSDYIKKGNIEEGRSAAKVGPPFNVFAEPSYAGYFTVNELTNSSLFFWFFVAENNPLSAPVVLWLNGGPGCSSLTALFGGAGPFSVDSVGETLISNPHSWHQNHNVLFLDQPVHTGFSFSNDKHYVEYSDEAAVDMYEALIQFYEIFPQYKAVPFFITGESYAGKYIPSLAIYIHKMNKKNLKKINLQGIAIGNGFVDAVTQSDLPEMAFQAGLLDITTMMSLQKLKDLSIQHITAPVEAMDYSDLSELVNDCSKNDFENQMLMYIELYCKNENKGKMCDVIQLAIEMNNITVPSLRGLLERECIYEGIMRNAENIDMYNFLEESGFGYSFSLLMNNPKTQNIIHALNKIFPVYLYNMPCEIFVNLHMSKDKVISIMHYLEELMDNYRVLLYSGQVDIMVSYPTSVEMIYNLKWNGAEDYKVAKRKFWKVDNKTVGYLKSVGNFTELLVRNAGHMVCHDQPYLAHTLITSFTRNILS